MNFERLPLSDLAVSIGSGISRPFYDRPVGRPVLRSNNIKDGKVLVDDLKYWHAVDPRGADLDLVTPRTGDALVNFVNGSAKELGKAAIFYGVPENCIATTNFFIVRFDKRKIIPSFANYFFQSHLYREWLYVTAGFSGQGSFNQKDFSRLPVPTPSVKEQQKIADILGIWDEAIEKLEELRAKKERRLRFLKNALVFGARQLTELHKTAGKVRHPWFTLPASWSCEPIGELATEVSERNSDGGQHEVLSCSKYDGFVRSLEYFKKQVFSSDLSGYKKIWRGDFGFPSNHIEEGSIGLQNLADVGVVSPIYTVFRFDPEKVDAQFAHAVLKTDVYRHIFEVSTSASVNRRGSLRWGEFSKIPFPRPPLVEQKRIAEVLSTAKRELSLIDDEIEAVKRQKRGLMQKLLTGEWRVPLDAGTATAKSKEIADAK